MSPFQGGGEGSRGNRRVLSVNVDVNESSGSDWDSDSDNAEDGEVLVRFCFFWIFFAGICVLEVFCCTIYFTATLPLSCRKQSLSRQVKECVLLLQRMATGSGISKVMLLILALDVSS
jgi:hypothetical protein